MEDLAKDFLELNELNKFYLEGGEKREVLLNVSLKIQEGQIVALLGRSGSGKSTLLNLLAGIDEPSSGSIRISETMLNELDEHQRTLFRRKNIGFVFQSFNLIPTLTVEENLLLPMELNGESAKTAKARVTELMQELGLGDRLESFPDRLSGGEQQRVAIARALIHDPNLVLADEPTGNLDRQTGEQALRLFRELIRKAGKTMIVATHSSDVLGIADRVISLEEGKLIENEAFNKNTEFPDLEEVFKIIPELKLENMDAKPEIKETDQEIRDTTESEMIELTTNVYEETTTEMDDEATTTNPIFSSEEIYFYNIFDFNL